MGFVLFVASSTSLMHYWMEVVMPHSGQTWTCSGADSSRLDKAEAVEEA